MNPSLPDRILDAAVELAEQSSWEKLTLHEIAGHLGISLNEIRQHFSVKDELVEAWYDRADSAMLLAAARDGFDSLSIRDRLYTLIVSWLDFLATHRKVSRDMLLYKLEPAHIHLQIQGVLRVSKTVQWIREAAQLKSTHLQRIAEEIGLTGIYLNTFIYWMFDRSEKQSGTRRFLERKLARAERITRIIFPSPPKRGTVVDIETESDTPGGVSGKEPGKPAGT